MITNDDLIKIFNKFNKEFFENALPKPYSLEFKFNKSYLGKFRARLKYADGGECEIFVSSAWQLQDEEIENTILHEMVHEWQWLIGTSDKGHGPYFKEKANEIYIKSNGKYKITRSANIEGAICLKNKNCTAKEIYLITYYKDGEHMFAKSKSYDSLLYFKSWLPTSKNVSEVKFSNHIRILNFFSFA